MKVLKKLWVVLIVLLVIPVVNARTGGDYFASYWSAKGNYSATSFNDNIVSGKYGYIVRNANKLYSFYLDGTLIATNDELEGSFDFAYTAKDNAIYVFTRKDGKTYIYKLNGSLKVEKKYLTSVSEDVTTMLKYSSQTEDFYIMEHSKTGPNKYTGKVETVNYIDLFWGNRDKVYHMSFADDFSSFTYGCGSIDEVYWPAFGGENEINISYFKMLNYNIGTGMNITAKDYKNNNLVFTQFWNDTKKTTVYYYKDGQKDQVFQVDGKVSNVKMLDNFVIINSENGVLIADYNGSILENMGTGYKQALGGSENILVFFNDDYFVGTEIGDTNIYKPDFKTDVKEEIEQMSKVNKDEEEIEVEEKEEVVEVKDAKINIQTYGKGVVSFDQTKVKKGEELKLDVVSETGYKLDYLKVVDKDGNEKDVTDNKILVDDEEIVIKAKFIEDESLSLKGDTVDNKDNKYMIIIAVLGITVAALFIMVLVLMKRNKNNA